MLQAYMAMAASYLSYIYKTKNKVKKYYISEFYYSIQGLKGEDKLAKKLSYYKNKAFKELQSLNPKGINQGSLSLRDFNFNPLSSNIISKNSLGVIRY